MAGRRLRLETIMSASLQGLVKRRRLLASHDPCENRHAVGCLGSLVHAAAARWNACARRGRAFPRHHCSLDGALHPCHPPRLHLHIGAGTKRRHRCIFSMDCDKTKAGAADGDRPPVWRTRRVSRSCVSRLARVLDIRGPSACGTGCNSPRCIRTAPASPRPASPIGIDERVRP